MATSTLRRGLKTEANNLAIEVRAELGLRPIDRLDPLALANHLAIPVASFSDYLAVEPAIGALPTEHAEEISAVTVHHGTRRLILVNDSHTQGRQNNSICHECAHALLMHEPHAAIDENGLRHWNAEYEAEAAWLGGALLIPNEAAWYIVRRRMPDNIAQQHYGVSQEVLTWRINTSGAGKALGRNRPPSRSDGNGRPNGRP